VRIVTKVLVNTDTLMIVVLDRDIVVCTAAILMTNNSGRNDMSNGREHDDRRKAQAAAARKHVNQARRQSRPGHGQRGAERRKAIKEGD
jgi:hypothetical protein